MKIVRLPVRDGAGNLLGTVGFPLDRAVPGGYLNFAVPARRGSDPSEPLRCVRLWVDRAGNYELCLRVDGAQRSDLLHVPSFATS